MAMAPFDLLVQQTKLTELELASLKSAIEGEYRADPMMQELRLVRTLHAIADGRVGVQQVLQEIAADKLRRGEHD
jgi:hypothetical protein